MRKDIPDISDSAYLLFVFILHRTSGSRLTYKDKKYINLTGANDPRKVFGWSERTYWKYKKELTDNKLIRSFQKGSNHAAMIFVTYSEYKALKASKSAKNGSAENGSAKSAGQVCQISRVSLPNTAEPFKDKEKLKRNERAEPQNASPRSLAPARSFGDLKSADLTPDEQVVLTALVALEPKYNNLKNVDRKKTFVEWCHVLTGNGYQEADMIQAVRDCYSDDRYKTFMASADQFLPFADEAKRQRIEMEESAYYVKLFGGTENE